METRATSYKAKQKGFAVLQLLSHVLLASLLMALGFKLIPVYVEYLTADRLIEALRADPDLQNESARVVQRAIIKGFEINDIDSIPAKSLKVKKKGQEVTVHLNYEVREHFMYNVELVLKFDKIYQFYSRM